MSLSLKKSNVKGVMVFKPQRLARLLRAYTWIPLHFLPLLSRLDRFLGPAPPPGYDIESPIYVCGMPRAGTTIMTVVLGGHPHVATHQVRDLLLPYAPHLAVWFAFVFMKLRGVSPELQLERVHKDGLSLTPNSPHAVEEIFWMRYFPFLHTHEQNEVFTATTSNSCFEAFYREHEMNLLAVRQARRYLTKNNYNISRLAYLLKLAPKARFVLMVRHPADHVASLLKQDRLFRGFALDAVAVSRLTGHFDFGDGQRCIYLNDQRQVDQVALSWQAGDHVRAWAKFWAMAYGFLAHQLATDQAVAQATLVVRYEDFCSNPGETLDRILIHTGLPFPEFEGQRQRFSGKIQKPSYYSANFTEKELITIREETEAIAARYGYTSWPL